MKHHIHCSGEVEPHVSYDKPAAGYRAELRCACRLVCRPSKRLHEKFVSAIREAKAMEVPAVRRRTRRKVVADIERGLAAARPPAPAAVNAAWISWWRDICARSGHESRL
jgi:hypothetical protein